MMKVFYWKDIKWINSGMADEALPTKDDFDKDWEEMPIVVEYNASKSVDGNLANVFSILNRDDNPLSTKENQDWIRNNLKSHPHTSMSVGDIVQLDKGEYYMVMNMGWQKIIFEGVTQ